MRKRESAPSLKGEGLIKKMILGTNRTWQRILHNWVNAQLLEERYYYLRHPRGLGWEYLRN